VNVSKFFARPKTVAAEMRDEFVELVEIRRRSKAAVISAKKIAFERNQRWVDWIGEILIDEKGKIPGTWVGRNFAYKPIAVKSSANLLEENLKVRVVRAFSTYLAGAAVE